MAQRFDTKVDPLAVNNALLACCRQTCQLFTMVPTFKSLRRAPQVVYYSTDYLKRQGDGLLSVSSNKKFQLRIMSTKVKCNAQFIHNRYEVNFPNGFPFGFCWLVGAAIEITNLQDDGPIELVSVQEFYHAEERARLLQHTKDIINTYALPDAVDDMLAKFEQLSL